MLMQVAAKRQPKQVDTMARDELGTCDVCGSEGKRVRSYLGKRCCSACRQVRSIIKNHPHRVERMYEEFHGELPSGSEATVAKLQERLETNKALRAEDLKKYKDLTDKYATLDAGYDGLSTYVEGLISDRRFLMRQGAGTSGEKTKMEFAYSQLSNYAEALQIDRRHLQDQLQIRSKAAPCLSSPNLQDLEEDLLTLSLAYIRQDGQTFSSCLHNMQYAVQVAAEKS